MANSGGRKKDYSARVKQKLDNSSRTGAACDRCKLRKIRCDADPSGCAGCRAASEPCETTDRITKIPQPRNHVAQLERENAWLKAKVQEHQQKLIDHGLPVLPDTFGDSPGEGPSSQGLQSRAGSRGGLGEGDSAEGFAPPIDISLWRRHMDNVPGSLFSNPAFSMLRGTKLSLFGMHIDISEFAEERLNQESPDTFSGFIHYANASSIKDHVVAPPLPPNIAQAREYAQWYFRFLNTYTPLLDRRQMDSLLVNVYSDPRPGPRPGRTAAEETMVHMMFSYIKFQYGQRNQMAQMTEEAMAHFKYAIGFVQQLIQSRTLQDIQAMSMIALQLRGFRRPGASWMWGQTTINLAIECGMNRSAEALAVSEQRSMDADEIEARKRVFWALYGLVTDISSRLGRPPPIRLADIDIEFPRPVHDYLEGEEHSLSEFQKCSFRVGISILKLLALQADMYCSFYTIAKPPPEAYARLVARYKADLEAWHEYVPAEIADSSNTQNELTMYAMYLELFEAEFRFLLYHPLLHPANQPASYRKNVQACEEAISDALRLLLRIRQLKSLDVPWHMTTILLAMTFTQLFVEDQRRHELTDVALQKLEADMNTWLDLFETVGTMLGSGLRLQKSVGEIIKNVLDRLKTDLLNRGALGAGDYGFGVMPGTHGSFTGQLPSNPTTTGYPSFGTPSNIYQPTQPGFSNPSSFSSAPRQVPSTPAPYTTQAPSGVPYGATSDASTPAMEWMRWSQANLNPFSSPAHREYANTLLSMGGHGDGRHPSNSTGQDQEPSSQSQWPMNFYGTGQ